jgi:AraC-like DNA-binding protein
MDALSEALVAVHMTGAIFFRMECTAPWAFEVPPLSDVAPVLSPGTERLVSYHLMTEGKATARFGETDVAIAAGDVLVIPHGDGHRVSNGRPARVAGNGSALDRYLAGTPSLVRMGGGGEPTRFVCGFFGCERHADRLFLSGLPQVIKVNLRQDARGRWLEGSIRHLVGEAESGRPGGSVLLSKMAEALFIETLRRYMEQLPPEQTGWLAAARDPVVGAAIAAMHRAPGEPWTIDALAEEAGASRTVLVERFATYLGEAPLAYLTRWRLQLAARRLVSSRDTVLQVALDVGYASEAAFSRAFRREFGMPPGRHRRTLAAAGAAPAPPV